MRKRYWVVLAVMAFAAVGNLIGGTDTPVRGALDPAAASRPISDIPAAPRFDATLFVSANSLNLRASPSTGGAVLASLPRNMQVLAGERRGGWVLVSANGQIGWVSGDYLTAAAEAPAMSVPRAGATRTQAAPSPSGGACPSRQYCTRIGSCEEARWYLANCSWGALLDGDSDGVPCEAICR